LNSRGTLSPSSTPVGEIGTVYPIPLANVDSASADSANTESANAESANAESANAESANVENQRIANHPMSNIQRRILNVEHHLTSIVAIGLCNTLR
jgi:hypothetical protein